MKNWDNPNTDLLIKALLQLKNNNEAKNFLRDLLTEDEIIEFGTRLKAATMLNQEVPYTKITKETGLSSTTIARISKWLKNGMGGYKATLETLKSHHDHFKHQR